MPYTILAARICLSLIFLNAGWNHARNFESFQGVIAGLGLPLAPLVAAVAIALLGLGGLAVLLGYPLRLGALLLLIFLIPTTAIVHNPLADPGELGAFLKNLGLIGGLLLLQAAAPGALSLEGAIARFVTPSPPPTQE